MNTRNLTTILGALALTLSACSGDSSPDGTPLGEPYAVTYNDTPFEITLDNIECGLTEATKETRTISIGASGSSDKMVEETFTAAPGNQYCRFEATATNLGTAPAWAQYIRQAQVDGKIFDNHDTNDLNAVTDGPPPWEHLQPGSSATITQWLELPEGDVEALIYPPGDDSQAHPPPPP
ncbi:hypothetical protein [Flaviflexus massiliensis]|uniref:hypothetical protein n=1 Tax=Flaviflexus massiliensis TaxID=1522309 RepID=UPI0006D58919|nr:hypothetical protein [Flaviflexus massiliensis]